MWCFTSLHRAILNQGRRCFFPWVRKLSELSQTLVTSAQTATLVFFFRFHFKHIPFCCRKPFIQKLKTPKITVFQLFGDTGFSYDTRGTMKPPHCQSSLIHWFGEILTHHVCAVGLWSMDFWTSVSGLPKNIDLLTKSWHTVRLNKSLKVHS